MFCVHACSFLVRRYGFGALAWNHIDFATLSLTLLFFLFCVYFTSATFITQLLDEYDEALASSNSVAESLNIHKPIIDHEAEWIFVQLRWNLSNAVLYILLTHT